LEPMTTPAIWRDVRSGAMAPRWHDISSVTTQHAFFKLISRLVLARHEATTVIRVRLRGGGPTHPPVNTFEGSRGKNPHHLLGEPKLFLRALLGVIRRARS